MNINEKAENKTLEKKYTKYYLLFYYFVILLLLLPIYFIINPGIIYNGYNKNIKVNDKLYNVKIEDIEGNIFSGLLFKNFVINNDKNELIVNCNKITIKPEILTFFTNKQELEKLDMQCKYFKIDGNVDKNFVGEVKDVVKNINLKYFIKNLHLKINKLEFNYTNMKNVEVEGKNVNFKNKQIKLKVKFNYFDKTYIVNI